MVRCQLFYIIQTYSMQTPGDNSMDFTVLFRQPYGIFSEKYSFIGISKSKMR